MTSAARLVPFGMSFLAVLGGVAGAVAGVFVLVVAVWACTAKPVEYQVITKKAEILPATAEKPKPADWDAEGGGR